MRTTRKKGTGSSSEFEFDRDEEKVEPSKPTVPAVPLFPRTSQGRSKPGAFPDGKTLTDVMAKDEYVAPSQQVESIPEVTFVDPAPHLGGRTGPVPTSGDLRVLKEQWISSGGFRALLRKGDIINASSYDMPSLLSQGVELEKA
jgi:hypothetical protein